MTKEVVWVSGGTSLGKAADLMKVRKIRHLPVMDGKQLMGIVTDRDLRRAMPAQVKSLEGHDPQNVLNKVCVRDIMTSRIVGVSPDVSIPKAAGLMYRNKIGCLPVLDEEALVGIITESDILRAVAEQAGDASRSQERK
jgi:acetoin utilization protein AcuB